MVFDSSTLILISKIELLDLFLDNVRVEVAIPKAVHEECCGGLRTLDSLMIEKAVDESRISVKTVKNKKLVEKLQADFTMGRGESEAIALAIQENALLVGIDDKRGISACKLAGIPFTTAIGILLRSREKELIGLEDSVIRLSSLGRKGRYKNSILEDAKRRLEGKL